MIGGWVLVVVTRCVKLIGGGVGAVGGIAAVLDRKKVEVGPCRYCVGSVDCRIKAEREGRIEGFNKTHENESAITYISPLKRFVLQSNRLHICCHLSCSPMRSYCLVKAYRSYWSVRIVNFDPPRTDLKSYDTSTMGQSSLS